MSTPELLKHILWLAIEDYSGLWEVVWEINSRYGELSETERMVLARQVVRDLASRGWVALYRCQEPYGDMVPLSLEEYERVLLNPANWVQPTADSVSIRISATEAGERAYFEDFE